MSHYLHKSCNLASDVSSFVLSVSARSPCRRGAGFQCAAALTLVLSMQSHEKASRRKLRTVDESPALLLLWLSISAHSAAIHPAASSVGHCLLPCAGIEGHQ
eukprot:6210968-Pleurochrysis_carterae.AAC.1